MARSIKPATRLARLFSTDDVPLYILSADGTIVFANEALGRWLDIDPLSIIGRQVVFGGAVESREAEDLAIAGLAPPPDVFYGTAISASIARETTDRETGRRTLIYREVRFIPIGLHCASGDRLNDDVQIDEPLLAVVATVGTTDLQEPILPIPDQSEVSRSTCAAVELHERVRQFRLAIACRKGTDMLMGDSPTARLARRRFDIAVGSRANTLIVGPLGAGRRQLAEAIFYTTADKTAGPLVPLACPLLADRLPSVVAETLEENGDSTFLLLDIDRLERSVATELFELLDRQTSPPRLLSTATNHGAKSRTPPDTAPRYDPFPLPNNLSSLLSAIVIELPPLASRREDLPVLIHAIVDSTSEDIEPTHTRSKDKARRAATMQNPRNRRTGVDQQTLEMLTGYDWPGEFAELLDTVSEAYFAADGPIIRVGSLSRHFRATVDASLRPVRPVESIDLDLFVDSIRKELTIRAMRVAKGNKAKAARLLGLTRPRLYRYVEQFGLDASSGTPNEEPDNSTHKTPENR